MRNVRVKAKIQVSTHSWPRL